MSQCQVLTRPVNKNSQEKSWCVYDQILPKKHEMLPVTVIKTASLNEGGVANK